MRDDLGQRIEFHSHTVHSDGHLLPAGLVREAEIRSHLAICLTDHIDASNLEEALRALGKFVRETKGKLGIKVFVGAEISYILPQEIKSYSQRARKLGAKIIIVHGESPSESVYPGTNHAAVSANGIADILAHPGYIREEEVQLAAQNGVFLELSARKGHRDGNEHVARLARQFGAKLVINTDAHRETDLITQTEAFEVARQAGLTEAEAIVAVRDNPLELLRRIERR